jgi:DNA-binding NarL/FixJ family response regulator
VIRVLIIAHLPLIREGLRALLRGEKGLQITSLPGVQAGPRLEEILAQHPDVVLLDVEVLEREGWVILQELRDLAPDISILVIGDAPNDRRTANALALGAKGYLLRESIPEEMAAAIRAARQGLYVLHPAAATTLLDELREASPSPSPAVSELGEESARPVDLIEPLSARELDVLRLMTRGLANKQIAAELFITEHTVKFHIRGILGKLGAANRTEAVTLALQKGLVSL